MISLLGAACGVELIIPSFTKRRKLSSAKEVEVSQQTASVRIHVEHIIRFIKRKYRILDCVLSLALLKTLPEKEVHCKIGNIN